jgi:hypothetical protein
MAGITGAEGLLPETIPEHPVPARATSAPKKTKNQRFMSRLFHDMAPARRWMTEK